MFNRQKDIRLSRLDLCYSRKKTNDKINFESFLKQCYDKVARNKAIKNISLQQNSLSWIFLLSCLPKPNTNKIWIRAKRGNNKTSSKVNLSRPYRRIWASNDRKVF